MKKTTFVPGVGIPSIILMVVVLCMSVLAVLSFVSAKNDKALADRSAEVAESVYRVYADAERTLCDIDKILYDCGKESADTEAYWQSVSERLPDGVTVDLETGVIAWTEEDRGRVLECEIETSEPGNAVRYVWLRHALLAETEEDTWN